MNEVNGLKKRYKMYKSGKFWVVASLLFLGSNSIGVAAVSAETTNKLIQTDKVLTNENPIQKILANQNERVDRNMSIKDYINNPFNAPILSNEEFYPIRVYMSPNGMSFYSIAISRANKSLRIQVYDFIDNNYELKDSVDIQAGEREIIDGKEFGLKPSGTFFYYASTPINFTHLILPFKWDTNLDGQPFVIGIPYFGEGDIDMNKNSGIYIPGEVTIKVNFKDEIGQPMRNTSGEVMVEETYTIYKGQTYTYNSIDIPGYKIKKPANYTGTPFKEEENNISIDFVYERNKEEHILLLNSTLEGQNIVSGNGIPGDEIIIKDSMNNELGRGTVDENGDFILELNRPLIKDETIIATSYTDNREGSSSEKIVAENIYANEINEVANEELLAIENDPTLTQEEKDIQKSVVETTRENALITIKDLILEKDLIEAKNKSIEIIKGIHQSEITLENQKNAAKEKLQKIADDTTERINNDNTLTTFEKRVQADKIMDQLLAANNLIDNVNNADQLLEIVDAESKNIETIYLTGTSIDNQKMLAKEKLNKIAEETITSINNEVTLTTKEKESQIANVKAELKSGENSINESTKADEIDDIVIHSSEEITDFYQSGIFIYLQKVNANAHLEEIFLKTSPAIYEDLTLTFTEKNLQNEIAYKAYYNTINSLLSAISADEIQELVESGSEAIEEAHKSGETIEVQKAKAKEKLESVAQETSTAIENDVTLTSKDKENQKATVTDALIKGKVAVDEIVSADELANVVANETESIVSHHESGDSLNVRKEAAKNDIIEAAKRAQQAIDSDPTLTTSEKVTQKALINQEVEKAIEALDGAIDANSVDEAKGNGIEKIDNQHQSGNNLDARKEQAKFDLEKEAEVIKNTINNDSTLTEEEKLNQVNGVEIALAEAKQVIDLAETATAVDEAKGNGIEKIDNKYQSGDLLETRKENAKQGLHNEAIELKEKINSDQSLTEEEKLIQIGGVELVLEKGIQAIDQATDADSIDQAKGNGIEEINNQYQPGNSLDTRKINASAELDAEAELIKNIINNDATLTAEDKANQLNSVEEALTNAKINVQNAVDANEVDSAKGVGVEKINNQYTPGNSLNLRKEAARLAIENESTIMKERIWNDSTLTDAEKATQTNGVDAVANNSINEIMAAIDASGVDNAKGNGIEQINRQYQPGTSIELRRSDAKESINQEALLIKERITNDSTLTEAEKATQIGGVYSAVLNAISAIDIAINTSEIDQAKGQGITNIDSQYKTSQPIEERKSKAKTDIDQAILNSKTKIANDSTLTTEEKAVQSAAVDSAGSAAKVTIDTAVDASGVDQAKGQGIAAIDNQYQPGTSINNRKELAKQSIDEVAFMAKERIANDPTLTTEEKSVQNYGVENAAVSAKANIDSALDASGIDHVKGQGVINIDNQYQPGTSLAARKEMAKAGIDQVILLTKEKIANDPTLTAEEKTIQSGAVDTAGNNAKSTIDAATDASSVDHAKGQGVTIIDNQYQPGDSLTLKKETAKADIDNEAKQIKEKIANDITLTKEEKTTQSSKVDKAAAEARSAIDSATNVAEINKAKGAGTAAIDNQYQPGSALDARKTAAINAIDEAAEATKNAIANDPTLTKEEKANQSKLVDESIIVAKEAIDQAVDASSVDKAKGAGIADIAKNYQPGSSLEARKTAANKSIDDAARVTKLKISNEPTLTDEEKNSQSKGVEQAAVAAKKSINEASSAFEVDSAKARGLISIDEQYKPGNALELSKTEAKKEIVKVVKETINKINRDSSLSNLAKETQIKGVEAAAVKAVEEIDSAKNTASVELAKNKGIANILNQYKSNEVSVTPGKVDVSQLINGDVKIKPIKPDGLAYSEGTEITIAGLGTFKLSQDGSIVIPNDKLKATLLNTSLVVTEQGKAASESISVNIPAKKAVIKDVTLPVKPLTPSKGLISTNSNNSTNGKVLPKTGSNFISSFFATLVGLGLSGIALLRFKKKEDFEG